MNLKVVSYRMRVGNIDQVHRTETRKINSKHTRVFMDTHTYSVQTCVHGINKMGAKAQWMISQKPFCAKKAMLRAQDIAVTLGSLNKLMANRGKCSLEG